ncbi:putative dsRNA-binding protein [Planobispora longispora]|uniref:DRBM domain-containing protein n=1 Tax=Planobispora longispora TaxID=28887 RepID=A0A8J3W4M7_9ACTN|nr:putative dsRNA-binding protein [Planobispora longispora]GIH75635.1 hypothetical protein Plo01_20640 [Planobispora longispora]
MIRIDRQPPADEVPPSRRRGGLAAIRGAGQDNPRSFFCRVCHRCENGLWVPAGWYLLERAPGGRSRHIRLGLYCSVTCLVRAGEMLQEGAAEHAARLGLPDEEQVRRERNRVTETAQTLLAGGMTVRQAADSLNVPTFTLKTWLKEAGIHLEPGSVPAHAAVPAGRNPVSVLNEQTQRGRIGTVTWETVVAGPAHAPSFTVTATALPAGKTGPVPATGTGPSKAAARTAAATALLAALGIG